jgi:hypothetical protein
MPVKFIAIYQDPWTNNTNEFVLILGWYSYALPSSSTGSIAAVSINILDPQGIVMVQDVFSQSNYEATEATAYPYAFSPAYSKIAKQVILIPPGWSLIHHQKAIGLQGTLEELKGYF